MSTQSDQHDRIQAARDSYSGKSLTNSQLQSAWAISSILHSQIQKTGSFREPLTDYAHAFARGERFDALRAESILRDVYTVRYEQSLNQTRESLLEREKTLPETAQARALPQAQSISARIHDGATQPFYQAYDRAAVALSKELSITQAGAKSLMKEAFTQSPESQGRTLYEVGKDYEDAYHRPAKEAEIAARKAEQLQTRAPERTR